MMMKRKTYWISALLFYCTILSASDGGNLVIIRHGEGEHIHQHVYSSWTESEGGIDHPLTEKGKQEVAETARQLLAQGISKDNVGLVLVSPMRRTKQTAQVLIEQGVCSEKVIQIEELIREPVAKDWEGGPTPPKNPNEHRWKAVIAASSKHGGETLEAIQMRLEKVIRNLSQWDLSKGHVILVTHGYPSMVLLELLGQPNQLLVTAEAKVLSLPLVQSLTP
ncbi:MAG: histidine phosphatase family protein [Parachlamydiales bacterium]